MMKNTAALMCTDLPAPDNGQVSYSPDTIPPYEFGTEATYTCNTGFGISSGNRTRTCGDINSEEMWYGVAATCDRKFIYCNCTVCFNFSDTNKFIAPCRFCLVILLVVSPTKIVHSLSCSKIHSHYL